MSAGGATVSIAAASAVTPFGVGTERLFSGLLGGQSCVGPQAWLASDRPALAASIPTEHLRRGEDRALQISRLAARGLRGALQGIDPARVGICVGSTQGAIERWQRAQEAGGAASPPPLPDTNGPRLAVADELGARGPLANPSMACASGTVAIGIGAHWLRDGRCDAVVTGGVDVLSRFVHQGFAALRALARGRPHPFDAARDGLALGEGAGLLLLRREGPRVSSSIAVEGWATASDAHHLTGPDPSGAGMARAVDAALADAALGSEAIDFISAHGTATVFNDLAESKAFARIFGDSAAQIPLHSIKGAIGHSLAAAGALEAIVTAMALERGLIPPTAGCEVVDPEIALDVVRQGARRSPIRRALSTSAGFGGINAALVLSRQG